MGKKIAVSYEGKPSYEICFERDFDALAEVLRALGYTKAQKLCIVTDSNVLELYGKSLLARLETEFPRCSCFSFTAGEDSKNTKTVELLYAHLIMHEFDRKDILLALGGGVVGDLTGFAAATYLRGITFIQLPTTLLSQVDSSIGGKTGVDFMQYKNMVGAFYMPRLVYQNISTLKTLSDRQFASGMGEVIKHGAIKDAAYLAFLREHEAKIREKDLAALEETVYQSCLIKRGVVERDPKEQGERALLNFGHTVGHAIEKLSCFTLTHGECVALGMISAGFLSVRYGDLEQAEFETMERLLADFQLPIRPHVY